MQVKRLMMTASNKLNARIAGLFYLIVVLTGIFTLGYIPSKLIITDNPAATFQKIVSSESLFRFGIVSGVICYLSFLFLVIFLYKLLSSVNENYARLMVILVVISIPISFINLQNQLTVLSLIKGSNYLNGLSAEQTQSHVLFCLAQYNNGVQIVNIFWGLWLFPFGYLVINSGILPKLLGILLMLGCFGYLINFLGDILIPQYSKMTISSYIRIPGSIGEIGICLWLLIMGAKDKKRLDKS